MHSKISLARSTHFSIIFMGSYHFIVLIYYFIYSYEPQPALLILLSLLPPIIALWLSIGAVLILYLYLSLHTSDSESAMSHLHTARFIPFRSHHHYTINHS